MFLRTAIAACAVATLAAAPSFAEAPAAPTCAETSFRVYFPHGASTLDSTTSQMLDVAARGVAECPYSELRVAVDTSSPLARARADAIANATDLRGWDAVRIVPRSMAQQASHEGGPEYAEVVISPHATAPTAPLGTTSAIGV